LATKVFLFIANYGRELWMGANVKKKGKIEKAIELVERMKKIQKEVGVALKKMQKNMKRQVDRGRRSSKKWKKEDRIMLSTKNLVFKKRLVRKLVDQYVGLYIIEKVISTNTVKLQLPTLIKIHLVINIS